MGDSRSAVPTWIIETSLFLRKYRKNRRRIHMKMKKVIALLMSAAMIFSLAACGNGGTGTQQGNNGETGDELDWTAGADASGGDVTIRYSTWRQSDEPYYQEIIKRFEEKYDWINVELEINSDASSYYSNLQADLMGGTAVDVFAAHSGSRIVDYATEGHLAPQTDFDYMSNYSDSAKIATTIAGENYGYLEAYNYFGFLYNKAAFEKVGATVPTTPDELIAVVNKLKAAGYGGAVVAGKTYGSDGFGRSLLMSSIGSEGYASLRAGIDDGSITDISEVEGVAEAFKTMQAYTENDIYYTAFEGIDYESGMSLYAQEKTAMVYSGSYIFGEKDTYFADIDTGFFAIPTYANSGVCYSEGAQVSCINANSKNLGAAKLWVEFLATAEISEYYCSNAKMLSTLNGVSPTFEEKEMITNSASDFALRALEEFENDDYWSKGFDTIYEGVIYDGEEWEGLVRVYTSKLEEYDLANQ